VPVLLVQILPGFVPAASQLPLYLRQYNGGNFGGRHEKPIVFKY